MTIHQLIQSGRPGTSHAWRIETTSCLGCQDERIVCTSPDTSLWHYGTRMLTWYKSSVDGETVVVYSSIGRGSVSDQNGMNIAFRTLGIASYYVRQGGAHIELR